MHETPPPPGAQWHVGAFIGFTLTLLPLLLVGFAESNTPLWLGTCVLAVVGGILGVICSKALSRNGHKSPWYAKAALPMGIIVPFLSAGIAVLQVIFGFLRIAGSSGRPLRRRGRARLPAAREDSGWAAPLTRALPPAPAEALAGWRSNAAAETASVAAFAHLSQELLALGAPASLLEYVHADARDEIHHARLCYGVASALSGHAEGPAPFPEALMPRDRPLTLEAFAAECVVESCVNEAASARAAALLAARSDVPEALRAVLATIASDEARHAAHGWEILDWCREKGGASVETAIQRALAGVRVQEAPESAEEAALARWGIGGSALWRRCVAEALRSATERVARSAPALARVA